MKFLLYLITILLAAAPFLPSGAETSPPPQAETPSAEFIYKCFAIEVAPFENKEVLKKNVLGMMNTYKNQCVGYNKAESKFLFQITCMTPCERNLDAEEKELRKNALSSLKKLGADVKAVTPLEFYELRNLLYNQR